MDHDQLFKQLISTFFVEFLELFFPEVVAYMDTSAIEFLDKEFFTDVVEGDEYEGDLVVKTTGTHPAHLPAVPGRIQARYTRTSPCHSWQ